MGDAQHSLVGRSFDWPVESGHFTVNPRGLKKEALSPEADSLPLKWESRFGSVTYTQLGPEFPYGGMNEKGLTIESLHSAPGNSYPGKDSSPAVNESQWIQFQLDTAATVEDVIENASKVRIAKGLVDEHYFICDPTGNCAVIDFEDGKQVVYSGEKLNARICTNDRTGKVQANLRGIKQSRKLDSETPFPESVLAPVAEFPSDEDFKDPISHAMSTLEKVKRGNTQLQIVYDMKNRKFHFKTPGQPIKIVDMSNLDFSFKPSYQVLDLDTVKESTGNVTHQFRALTDADYAQLKLRASSASMPDFAYAVEALRAYSLHMLQSRNILVSDGHNCKVEESADSLISQIERFRGVLKNSREKRDSVSLHSACWVGDIESVTSLAKSLAPNVDLPNDYGLTPIQLAVTNRSTEAANIVRVLLENGANFYQLNKDGRTLLQIAENGGALPEVIRLLGNYPTK